MAKTFRPTGPSGEEVTDAGGGRYQYLAGGRIWQDFDPDEIAGQFAQFKADNPLSLASGLERIPGYIPTQAGGATGDGTNATRFRDPATGKEYYGFGSGIKSKSVGEDETSTYSGVSPWYRHADGLTFRGTQGDIFKYADDAVGETDFGGQRYYLTNAVGDTTMTAPPRDTSSNFFDDIWENPVVMAGLAAFLGPQIAGAFGGGMAGAAGSGAILGGGRAALTGGDIGRGALMGGLGGAAINGLGNVFGDSGALTGTGSMPSVTDELSFTGRDYGNAAGMSAAEQIATGPQFANNVVPGSVSTDTPIDNFTPSITDELSFADSNYWTNPINSMLGPTEYGGGGGYGTSVGAPESIGGGAFGPGSIAAGAGAAGSWSALAKEALGYAGPAMAIGSALYGFDKAGDLRDSVAGARASMAGAVAPIPGQPSVAEATAKAQSLANPWQTSGGTDLATTQLKNFMQSPDPSMQVGKPELDPAFAARIQGAQRATANYGQDSGNMAIAGANASSTWYNERLQQLANLAGAPGNPVGAAQIGLQGQALGQAQQQLQLQAATGGASNSLAANQAANDLVSRSLASGAYGATRLAGGSTQFTPAMLEALRRAGITFTGMPL